MIIDERRIANNQNNYLKSIKHYSEMLLLRIQSLIYQPPLIVSIQFLSIINNICVFTLKQWFSSPRQLSSHKVQSL